MTAVDFNSWVERARTVPIEDVIARRNIALRKSGVERIGPCPKCGGTDRFSINTKDNVWHCRGCKTEGDTGDVIGLVQWLDGVSFNEAVEKLTGDAKPANGFDHHAQTKAKAGKPSLGKVVATYDYIGRDDKLAFQVVRLEPKDFRQRRPDPMRAGDWIWSLEGVPIIPYRLTELDEALGNGRPVFIVEGEKDVDNLRALGVPATCNPRGAGKWGSCKIDHYFEGADVIIIADNDPASTNKRTGQILKHANGNPRYAGWDHAQDVAKRLFAVNAEVRVIDLKLHWPECPDKGDISDWIAAGFTAEQLYNIAEEVVPWVEGDDLRLPPSKLEDDPKITPLRYVDLGAILRAREWFIKDLIPMFNVTLFSGEGAVGKSIALMQLAVACVLARPWFGINEIQCGPVLYIAAEEDADEMRRRFEAIATHGIYNSTRDELRNGLRVLCFAGDNALLASPDRHGLIQPTPLYEQIKADAVALKPKLIVVDPVADVFGGQENDRAQTRMFCTLLRRLAIDSDAALIASSHPSLTGLQTDSGLSGSTAWHNSVRARMYFKAIPEDIEGAPQGTRALEIKKNNYGPVSKKIIVQWDNGLYIMPREASLQEKYNTQQKIDNQFLSLMRRFEEQGRNVSDNRSAPNYAPTAFANSAEGKTSKLHRKALIDSMERLLQADRIRVVTEGPPSKRRSRLVLSNLPSNSVPTDFQPNFDDMGWNGLEEAQNDAFQPPSNAEKKDNDFNGSSGPPVPPYAAGLGRPAASARVGSPPANQPRQAGDARKDVGSERGWKPTLHVLGDAAKGAHCARCNRGSTAGDVVKKITDGQPGSKAETLHLDCAEKFFEALRKP